MPSPYTTSCDFYADGYGDFTEVAAPANPAANRARLYAKDVAGRGLLHGVDDGGFEYPLSRRSVLLGADVSTTGQAFVDATGLSFSIDANVWYHFQFLILFQTVITTTGIAIAVNGPTLAANGLAYNKTIYTSLTATTPQAARAYNTGGATTGVDTANANLPASLEGNIRCTASGTLIVRFFSEIAGSAATVKAGSCGLLTVLG